MPAKADPSAVDPITAIYDINTKLEEAVKSNDTTTIQSLSPTYTQLINYPASPTATDSVKQLCADYIPKYVHLYPDTADTAINRQFDLCEDNNNIVRIHAIRGLETIAKNLPTQVQRCSDVLSQLLITDDSHELAAVKQTLTSLFNIDLKAAFAALFTQLNTTDDTNVKQRITEFATQMLQQKKVVVQGSNEVKQVIADGYEKLLLSGSVSETDFPTVFEQYMRYVPHKKKADDAPVPARPIEPIVLQYAQLDSFDVTDDASVKRYVSAAKFIGQNIEKHSLNNTQLFTFWIDNIASVINTASADNQQLLYRQMAIMARLVSQETARASLQPVYDLLLAQLPSGNKSEVATVNFTAVELLLYTFHILASLSKSHDLTKQVCGLFTPTGQPGESTLSSDLTDKRSTFINKLEHLNSVCREFAVKSNAVATNLTQLNKAKDLDKEVRSSNQKQINAAKVAAVTAESIQQMVKPLTAKVPSFIAQHYLSFQHHKRAAQNEQQKGKPQQQQPQAGANNKGQKRKSVDNQENNSQKRQSTGNNNNKQQQKGGGKPQQQQKGGQQSQQQRQKFKKKQ